MKTENRNDQPWHPTREDAYRAAVLVTKGKCAAHIAKQLYKNSKPGSLMRVARLLHLHPHAGRAAQVAADSVEVPRARPRPSSPARPVRPVVSRRAACSLTRWPKAPRVSR